MGSIQNGASCKTFTQCVFAWVRAGNVENVSELTASYNEIQRIAVSDLRHLSSVRKLVLSHNKISFVEVRGEIISICNDICNQLQL